MTAGRFARLVVLLLGSWWTAGCGQRTTVEFWAMGREGEAVAQLLPEFHRLHPELRVKVQQIPWTAAHEKLLTAYAGGSLPDVFQLGSTWLPEFAALGAVAPVPERVRGNPALPPDDYFPAAWQSAMVDGGLYGIPWYVDTRLVFYRTDLLAAAGYAELPTDWPGFLAALRAVKRRQGEHQYAILLPINQWQVPVILGLQRGAALLRDHLRYGDFSNEAFRAGFDSYLQLFAEQLAPPPGDSQGANLYADFAAGYYALFISGPWSVGELRRRLPPDRPWDWRAAPLPSPTGVTPGLSLAGGASLVVNRRARHPDAAWKLIEFLSTPAQQVAFYRLAGDLPARLAAWNDPALANDPAALAFRVQLTQAAPPPRIPEWEQIAHKLAEYAERAVRGELSAGDALTLLDREVYRILEKRRWLLRKESSG